MSYANKRGHAKAFDSGIAGAEFITRRDYNNSYVRVGVRKLGRKEGSVKCFRVANKWEEGF